MNDLQSVETPSQKFDLVFQSAQSILEQSRKLAVAIKDQQSFEEAGEYRKMVNSMKKEAIEDLEPIRKTSYDAYKAVLDKVHEVVEPFNLAMVALDVPLAAYFQKQEAERKAEEARLAAEAKKQAEDAQFAAAVEADQSGDKDKAAAILEQSVVPITPQIAKTKSAQGVGFSKLYSVNKETINMKLLVQAVAEGKAPLAFLLPNVPALNSHAKSVKDEFKVPGVELVVTTNVSSRSK